MEQQKLMASRTIYLALTLAVMIAVPTVIARAQSSEIEPAATQSAAQGGGLLDVAEQIKLAQAQVLEGSWTIVVTPAVPPGVPQPPSFNVYGTFARGSAFIGTDRAQPFAQHGVWAHLGGNRFAYNFKQDTVDSMGNFTGVFAVRVRLTLAGRDEFVGPSCGEQRDASGNVGPPSAARFAARASSLSRSWSSFRTSPRRNSIGWCVKLTAAGERVSRHQPMSFS